MLVVNGNHEIEARDLKPSPFPNGGDVFANLLCCFCYCDFKEYIRCPTAYFRGWYVSMAS